MHLLPRAAGMHQQAPCTAIKDVSECRRSFSGPQPHQSSGSPMTQSRHPPSRRLSGLSRSSSSLSSASPRNAARPAWPLAAARSAGVAGARPAAAHVSGDGFAFLASSAVTAACSGGTENKIQRLHWDACMVERREACSGIGLWCQNQAEAVRRTSDALRMAALRLFVVQCIALYHIKKSLAHLMTAGGRPV